MSVKLPNDQAAALREMARRLDSGSGAEFSGDHVFTVNTGELASECRHVADEAERKQDAINAELRCVNREWLVEFTAHGATLKKLHAAEAEADALRKASQDRLVCSGCGASLVDGVMAIIDGKVACCPDCSTMSVAERNDIRDCYEKRNYALRATVERVKALAESWLAADVASATYGSDVLLELAPDATAPEAAPVPPKCEECEHSEPNPAYGRPDCWHPGRRETCRDGKNFEPRKEGK